MTLPETPAPLTPNASLALIVVEKLKENGSISADKAHDVLSSLETGTATAQDWRLWIELALINETGAVANVQN